MDNRASILFKSLFDQFSSIYKQIRENAVLPNQNKTLREWGITDAAEMIGRSSQTIRNYEESQKLPEPRQIGKGKRKERVYSLSEINHLRDFFGTRKKKPNSTVPAKIGFVNFKGGAAKTTSGVCAAQYLAMEGYKVLLVDCDSQASATQMFGYIADEDFSERDTILNILTGDSQNIKNLIKKTYWDSLDLIPANLSLYNAELIIPTQIADHTEAGKPLEFFNKLNQAIKKIENDYDVIIFDCPPSMGMISINAIYAANSIIISMPPVLIDFASTKQFFKMVSEVLERLPEKEYNFVRVLITKHNGRNNAQEICELLKIYVGQHTMTNYMIESEAISKAASNLQTLYEIDKYAGDKKTYKRALEYANRANEEIEKLIVDVWEKKILKESILAQERVVTNG